MMQREVPGPAGSESNVASSHCSCSRRPGRSGRFPTTRGELTSSQESGADRRVRQARPPAPFVQTLGAPLIHVEGKRRAAPPLSQTDYVGWSLSLCQNHIATTHIAGTERTLMVIPKRSWNKRMRLRALRPSTLNGALVVNQKPRFEVRGILGVFVLGGSMAGKSRSITQYYEVCVCS